MTRRKMISTAACITEHVDDTLPNPKIPQLIRKTLTDRWEIDLSVYRMLPKMLAEIAADPGCSDHDRLGAVQVLLQMDKDQIDAAVQLDRINRLRGSRSTENPRPTGLPPWVLEKLEADPEYRQAMDTLAKRQAEFAAKSGVDSENG